MKTLTLPERLDSGAAPVLYQDLSQHLGQDVTLDAAALRHLGTLCTQVLLSAARTWRNAGAHFTCTSLGPEASAQLSLLGVSPSQLTDQSYVN